MISPLEEYKSLSSVSGIESFASEILFTNYLKLNLKGDQKLIEIDSTDQESVIKKYNGGRPVPGMVYTFFYRKGVELFNTVKGDLKYIDAIPLVFCLNTGEKDFLGINFNFVPKLDRVKFFESYFKFYTHYLSRIEEFTEQNKLAINDNFIKIVKSEFGSSIVLDVFKQWSGTNFSSAIRKYDIKNIENFRMIEIQEWKYIPFYNSLNTIKKINEIIIQQEFIANQTNI